MSIEKFNKNYAFDYDLKEVKMWKKARKCLGETVSVKVLGVHPSKDARYGDSPFLITNDDTGINLPGWYASTVRDILKDPEAVTEIKSGHVTCYFRSRSTKNGETVVPVFKVD